MEAPGTRKPGVAIRPRCRVPPWLALLGAAVACTGEEPVPTPDPQAGFDLGPEIVCASPRAGFDRLVEQGAERGLAPVEGSLSNEPGCWSFPPGIVARDMDGDGDIDLLLGRSGGFPTLYVNDGKGGLTETVVERPEDLATRFGRPMLGLSAVDLDGDSLPEVALVAEGLALLSWNLGEHRFSEPQVLFEQVDYPRDCIHTMSWGDADGDGDLDLALPTADRRQTPASPLEPVDPDNTAPDLLLLNEGGAFTPMVQLSGGAAPTLSLFGLFTDRDNDGDADLLIGSDRGDWSVPPTAFYRNDGLDPQGLPLYVDDAAVIGADLGISAMGAGISDFNEDGLLDYCLTTTGARLMCLASDGAGGYFESAVAMGLQVDLSANPDVPAGNPPSAWTGWSVVVTDLDNDGLVDVATAAGQIVGPGFPSPGPGAPAQPDALWQGMASDRFEERSVQSGFADLAHHYGMAAADFEGDGYPDLVMAPLTGRPALWSNPCGAGAWLDVELAGPPGNTDGLGAHVTLEVGGRTILQELAGPRSLGQGPARLHFGLGAAEVVDSIVVSWPDGAQSRAEDLPVRRLVSVTHPEFLD